MVNFKRYGSGILACVLVAGLLCGCAGRETEKEPGNAGRQTEQGQQEQKEAGQVKLPGQGMQNDQEEIVEEEEVPVVFEGQDMDGNTVTSDIFSETKLTMVNVWATYCNPCLMEMPELGELAGEYDAETFRLIGIVSDVQEGTDQKTLEEVKALIEQTGADYPHLLLNMSLYNGLLMDVTAVPTTFFVNEEGIVVKTLVGARDKASWKEVIDGLLEED